MAKKRILSLMLTLMLVFGAIVAGCRSAPALTSRDYPQIISSGSGFFISADGYIVTCAHVIEDANVIGVWVGETGFRAELVAIDHETDVAILKIDHRPQRFFRLADFSSARRGDRVFVLGFPMTNILGSEIRLTDGLISALSGFEGSEIDFQISAPVQPGNSGGPVFNERFEVLGIAASIIRPNIAMNISFAVKNTYIRSLLPSGVRLSGGNVRNLRDAERATVQISIDGIFDGPPITIVNNTGLDIREIYISPQVHSTWGQNRLARNQILNNGDSIALNLTFPLSFGNRYDIRVVDTSGAAHTQMNVTVVSGSRIVFEASPLGTFQQVGNLFGTFVFSANDSITFSGNNYTLRITGHTFTGTYSISGNTFTLAGHGSTTNWIRGIWTIIDSYTIRDSDGDVWRRTPTGEQTGLSGTFSFDQVLYITFSGNSFTLRIADVDDIITGSFSVSGNTFILTGHGINEPFMTEPWIIVDSNTLRDADGDLWMR